MKLRRPDWTYGFFYRAWARLLHRFNLHHTHEIGPFEDGVTITKCEWCGLSKRNSNRLPGDDDEWPFDDDPPDPL